MPNDQLELEPSGSTSTARPPSPKAVEAQGKARDAYTRTVFGGVILVLLCIAYGVSVYVNAPRPEILGIVGTGLGFLLGQQKRSDS